MSNNPIQFRAWNGHKMCRVDSISFNAGGMIWHGPGEFGWGWIDETFEGWTPDNPKPEVVYPVMRWTGLRDSLGHKVWEGDIVRWTHGVTDVGVVEYRVHDEFGSYPSAVFFGLLVARFAGLCQFQSDDTYEVIGDLYSNPDLLKS